MKHICTTYSEDPKPGECPAHPTKPTWCLEHRQMCEHDECEACDNERNGHRYTEEELIADFSGMTGSLCDGHLRDEMYEHEEGDVIEVDGVVVFRCKCGTCKDQPVSKYMEEQFYARSNHR